MTDRQKRKDFTLLWVWVIVLLTLGAVGGVYYYFDKEVVSEISEVDTSTLKSPFEEVNKDAKANKTAAKNGKVGSLKKEEY